MRKQLAFLGYGVLLLAASEVTAAQTYVQLAPSSASQTITQQPGTSLNILGNVGIGTAAPAAPLHIANPFIPSAVVPMQIWDPLAYGITQYSLSLSAASTISGLDWRFTQTHAGAAYPVMTFSQGLVGINTTTPQNRLSVDGGMVVDQNDDAGSNMFSDGPSHGLTFGYASGEGIGSARLDGTANQYGLDFYTAYTNRVSISESGNVGIGTSVPGAGLEVANGNVKISGAGAHLVFPDGSIQSIAYTGNVCTGGDYAESVDVVGSRKSYEPGDVMIIDGEGESDVTKSTQPYSTQVVGIYSTKPGVVGRRQTVDPKLSSTEIPMAMIGIVPTKVTAENGPIHRGDLLVTSSTVGYAMRGTDRSRMVGAVVGKALGSLESGKGVIEVVVTLQ